MSLRNWSHPDQGSLLGRGTGESWWDLATLVNLMLLS